MPVIVVSRCFWSSFAVRTGRVAVVVTPALCDRHRPQYSVLTAS
jgi:hypothetical protein